MGIFFCFVLRVFTFSFHAGMGFAAQNGKFLPSNIGLAAITALALYCVMLLCRVHDHVGQSVTSLEDIAFVVASSFSQKFGRISRLTVKTIISYTQSKH